MSADGDLNTKHFDSEASSVSLATPAARSLKYHSLWVVGSKPRRAKTTLRVGVVDIEEFIARRKLLGSGIQIEGFQELRVPSNITRISATPDSVG